jgi:hypothetical protein
MNEETENYPLDDAALEALADIDKQEQMAMISLAGARQGILNHFAKIHKLAGNWRLADNKQELVKVHQSVQQ